MSDASSTQWPTLSVNERRVLGVLVEKQKTTDTYPLTLNSLVTGSNQKSNRDPTLDLEDIEVEEAMTAVQKKGLAMRIIGGRVDKWRHLLYDAWKVNTVEIAVMAELLLRGPQTEGELRNRASRMEDIADLDTLRNVLTHLKERGLVVYLTPEGRRGTVVTHGFHEPHERERLRKYHLSQPSDSSPTPPPATVSPPSPGPDSRLEDALAQIAQLTFTVDGLRAEMTRLSTTVEALQKELGVSPS